MNALHFLTINDFNIQDGAKGPIMCHNMKGLSLILFYSVKCVHCQTLIPIFKTLPATLGICHFGMVNISNNFECIRMSQETIDPIKVVPYILLYVNGKPYIRYNGSHDRNEIINFVVEVSKKIQNRQQFVSDKIKVSGPNRIPEYSIGVPLRGDDDNVCYLRVNELNVTR
jgi:hypothetical protein